MLQATAGRRAGRQGPPVAAQASPVCHLFLAGGLDAHHAVPAVGDGLDDAQRLGGVGCRVAAVHPAGRQAGSSRDKGRESSQAASRHLRNPPKPPTPPALHCSSDLRGETQRPPAHPPTPLPGAPAPRAARPHLLQPPHQRQHRPAQQVHGGVAAPGGAVCPGAGVTVHAVPNAVPVPAGGTTVQEVWQNAVRQDKQAASQPATSTCQQYNSFGIYQQPLQYR